MKNIVHYRVDYSTGTGLSIVLMQIRAFYNWRGLPVIQLYFSWLIYISCYYDLRKRERVRETASLKHLNAVTQ